MKNTRTIISVFLAVAAIVWWGSLWLRNVPVSSAFFAPFASVVSALAGLALLLDKCLWRQTIFQKWLVSRPDLRGTWKVDLQSSWIDPTTGEAVGLVECYMGVSQTLTKLQCHLMTPESESWFVAESIVDSPNDHGYQIVGVYRNKPRMEIRAERSSIHYGALLLDTHGENSLRPTELIGEYWTDRKTTGSLHIYNRQEIEYTNYQAAHNNIG